MGGPDRNTASPKTRVYEEFAKIGKALANPARLELLDLLAQGERSVEELAQAAAMKVSNTSAQLKTLAAAGLVTARRQGAKVFYRLTDDQVVALVDQMQGFAAARSAGANRAARDYLGDVQALEPVSMQELARRIETGQVVVLDVRPPAEFAAGHLPGALNLPPGQLADRLAELADRVPPGAGIVAYCRGRYCVLAPQAVRVLREHGYSAFPLDGGLPQWRLAGLPVVSGSPA
ncbi:ArsR/SmtB family transcription factor [Actinomadura kijaniata]|uniref:ArsR/SmtB family transcription factor n=1 Tax=Actinomadura kijaniata TaxID=46161 RepID=UPI000833C3FA|nr:metalloregulator ArsR/SmtB family transcription factor [Actinomadura kijaniata]